MSSTGRFPSNSRNSPNSAFARARRNLERLMREANPEDILSTSADIFVDGVNVRNGDLADEVEAKSVLQVTSVDYHISSNAQNHHTDEYDLVEREEKPQLVVRRGSPFTITVKLSKPYQKEKDDLRLIFEIGTSPMVSKGTRVELLLSEKDEKNQWGAKIESQDKENLKLNIFTPPDCKVGKWKFIVSVIKTEGRKKKAVFKYTDDNAIYILFNAWHKDDQVYHPDDTLRGEYVLNDLGVVFLGSKRGPFPRRWNFGQFEGSVLDCAIYLLDESDLKMSSRGDPVKVARKMSAMANIQDDYGVLVGNWSGDYEGGTSPTEWNGSVAILEKYYETKEPVMYGQCWVFSSILTTLCRTIGIPARSVTNFSSAHDTDGSVTIDKYISENDEDEGGDDSVWNFHVWNDVWMSRPDLPKGYGGWQAIDATPQEASDGIYQCGPAPVSAIKNGEIYMPYDCGFVFAEVNADYVYWYEGEDGKVTQGEIINGRVGLRVLTNNPYPKHEWDVLQDVTSEYKFPEGSPEENAAKLQANLNSTKPGIYGQKEKKDMTFELIQKDVTNYGDTFEAQLRITNQSNETRTVGGVLKVFSVFTTGVKGKKIKVERFKNFEIPKKSTKDVSLSIPVEEYDDKLVEHCCIKTAFLCRVKETNQVFADDETFVLEKPTLNMKAPSEVKLGEKFKVQISFTNPLDKTLTNCRLNIECPKIQKALTLRQWNVASKQTFMTTVELEATKPKTGTIIANFFSKELVDIKGSCQIEIKKA